MHHVRNPKPEAPAHRVRRTTFDPYLLDEVTFTLSDIRRARAESGQATRA